MTHRLAVLISGSGTNLQAIIDAVEANTLDADIGVVLSNRADAGGLQRAQNAGLATEILDHRQFDSRESFDQAMVETLDRYQPDTVVLAGFMRILSP
ncbi:MAG: formyltransferase family protein, partial [Pseudomonadota bacterium]|nr:formyltransferase family protein [Pseudomonadota bacterium]